MALRLSGQLPPGAWQRGGGGDARKVAAKQKVREKEVCKNAKYFILNGAKWRQVLCLFQFVEERICCPSWRVGGAQAVVPTATELPDCCAYVEYKNLLVISSKSPLSSSLIYEECSKWILPFNIYISFIYVYIHIYYFIFIFQLFKQRKSRLKWAHLGINAAVYKSVENGLNK